MSSDYTKHCGRLSYLKINLDAITNNVSILLSRCGENTGIIAVVKAGAYGHGSREVSKHLQNIGVQRLAVATPGEGAIIRGEGVTLPIHVLGNNSEVEIPEMIEHGLIPTACTEKFIRAWAGSVASACVANSGSMKPGDGVAPGSIDIKIDTGLTRNGAQPQLLPRLVQLCDDLGVPIDAIFTHFSQSLDDPKFTKQQLDVFMEAAGPYKARGIKLHVSNSGAIIRGCGTDLDFVRPGIAVYGLTPENDFADEFEQMGFQPALSWRARASLCKTAEVGRVVGYGQTYRCDTPQRIATISVGYADGFLREFSSSWAVRDCKGNKCPVVGRVSMDAITVRLDASQSEENEFYILSDDFDDVTSAAAWAKRLDTITYTVATGLSVRLPRLYICNGKPDIFINDLQKTY